MRAKSPSGNHKKLKPPIYNYKPSYNHASFYNSPKKQSQPLSCGSIKGIAILITFIIWLGIGLWSGFIGTWQWWFFLPILLVAAITGKRNDMRRARYYAGSG